MTTLRAIPGFALVLGLLGGCAAPEEPAPDHVEAGADRDAPPTSSGKADDPAAGRTPLQAACDAAADEVDTCLDDAPAASCQPTDAGLGLSCCNAFGPDALASCGPACEADAVAVEADLSFLREHFGPALVHAESYVVPTCGGVGFEDVVAEHRAPSEALSAAGIEGWGEGQSVEVLDGLLLQSIDGVLPGLRDLGHDDRFETWRFGVEVVGEDALHHYSKFVLFFPRTGVVVVIEGEVAFI